MLNLGQPSVVVPIGGQVDLIDTTVSVANQFPSSALIKDTWTVNTFNAGSDDAKLRYRIKGTKP